MENKTKYPQSTFDYSKQQRNLESFQHIHIHYLIYFLLYTHIINEDICGKHINKVVILKTKKYSAPVIKWFLKLTF